MKPAWFLGDSLKVLREFPADERRDVGRQIRRLQDGRSANDFKPMTSVGKGVEEIRIRGQSGAYRVIYTAHFAEAVYVIHAFQKKSQATSKRDVNIARSRFQQLLQERR